ncbi:GABA permease GabA [Aspergillus fumigatus]|nr:GABA permease GabA [Aspergillus fumigatus]
MAVEEVELKGNVHVQSGRSNGDNGLLAGSKELRQRNQLERYLNFFSTLAFSATLMASWETVGGSIAAGLLNGGPSAIVYGMVFSTIGSVAVAASLAELASESDSRCSIPLDLQSEPEESQTLPKFLSRYVFSWSSLVCLAPFLIGNQILGLVSFNRESYHIERYQGTLLMWAVLIIPIIINIYARRVLAVIEVAAGIMHIVFLPVTIAVLVALAPRNPDEFVWNTFVSGISGWSSPGVAWAVGLLGVVTPLGGVDGVIHMAEEVKMAPRTVPRSMIWGTITNGIMAFGYAIAVLYCMGDYMEALTSPTGYPIITIVYQATRSKTAVNILMAMGLLPGWIALFNGLASVTRLTWAFARDNGLPFSDFFVHIDRKHKIPIRALFLVATLVVLLSFIQIGSTAAFNAILSISTLGLYFSYIIPLILLVIKRFREPQDIPRGVFHMGRWGLPVNLFAIAFAIYVSIFLPFPAQVPVTGENMNYAGPVLGAVMIFACVDWVVRGRRKWVGPTIVTQEDRR